MVKRFRHFLQESLGEGKESFEDKLDSKEVTFENLPKEWEDVEVKSCEVKFTTSLEVRKYGIEDIDFTLESIDISYIVTIEGEEETRYLRYSPSPEKVQIDKLDKFPYYAHDIVINMYEQEDEKNFFITISFGNDE